MLKSVRLLVRIIRRLGRAVTAYRGPHEGSMRHDASAETAALNRVCDEVDTQVDPAFGRVARTLLAQVEW